MKPNMKTLCLALCAASLLNCGPKNEGFQAQVVYQSDLLIITQISKNAFEHTSFIQTQDFGNVPSNGLIVSDHGEALVFDTPTNDESSAALIQWLRDTLHFKIKAIIPTHFHSDCLGGLQAFHDQNIPSYANFKTIELAKEHHAVVPKNSFKDSLVLKVGTQTSLVKFFGEGHTKDNVVGYFPSEHILFGGCLIKTLDASKGYLGDANLADWSSTVQQVKKAYPNVKLVVPGHGDYGNSALLDYTIALFKTE
ncbi:subclass B1 metallo-beta-lactamase [Flavobacteriaceae bacterium LMO-SS05]